MIDQYSEVACWCTGSVTLGRKTFGLSKLLHSLPKNMHAHTRTHTQRFLIASFCYYPVVLAEHSESRCLCYVHYILYMQLQIQETKSKDTFLAKRKEFCKTWETPNVDVVQWWEIIICLNCESGNKDRSKQICYTSLLGFPAKYRRDYLGTSCVWTLKNYWNLSQKSFWSLWKWVLYYYRLLYFNFNLMLDFLSSNAHDPEKTSFLEELYL